jgi:S-phase kinase-associated protein 1
LIPIKFWFDVLTEKMVKCQLQCQSGKIFQVEVPIIQKSIIIKNMLEDLGIGKDETIEVEQEIIPLPNLSEACMEKMIEWCTKHKDDPPPPQVAEGEDDLAMFNDEISPEDQEFLKMEDSTLFDLILAANYLDIKGLLDLTTTHVAHLIVEARTPEGIRKRFNIKNDLTPEDLKKIEKEAQTWLDSDSDEDGDKKDKKAGESAGAAAAAGGDDEPRPSTSREDEPMPMERSPLSGEESEESELEGAVGGAVGGHD